MQDFQKIDVRMKTHIVRVVNDEVLMQALDEGKHRAARLLAQKIREDYQQQYAVPGLRNLLALLCSEKGSSH